MSHLMLVSLNNRTKKKELKNGDSEILAEQKRT